MQSRREFLVSIVSAVATVHVLGACGSDERLPPDPDDDTVPTPDEPDGPDTPPDAGQPPPPPPEGVCPNGTRAAIGTNHGHTLSVSVEDVRAAVNKSYDIRGTSDHPHTLTVTAAMFAALARNEPVTLNSTSDAGHAHTVSIVCA